MKERFLVFKINGNTLPCKIINPDYCGEGCMSLGYCTIGQAVEKASFKMQEAQIMCEEDENVYEAMLNSVTQAVIKCQHLQKSRKKLKKC